MSPLPPIGYLLVHKTRGILMGSNRAGRVTWSSVDPSYRRAMPCADSIAQVAQIIGKLGIPAKDHADYSICVVAPDCHFNDSPFLSPEGVRSHGLGAFLNNYLPLDFVGTQGTEVRAERRRIARAIQLWCEGMSSDSTQGMSLFARMCFIRRMLRKGALNIEVTDGQMKLCLAPNIDLTEMEPAGHA